MAKVSQIELSTYHHENEQDKRTTIAVTLKSKNALTKMQQDAVRQKFFRVIRSTRKRYMTETFQDNFQSSIGRGYTLGEGLYYILTMQSELPTSDFSRDLETLLLPFTEELQEIHGVIGGRVMIEFH